MKIPQNTVVQLSNRYVKDFIASSVLLQISSTCHLNTEVVGLVLRHLLAWSQFPEKCEDQ